MVASQTVEEVAANQDAVETVISEGTTVDGTFRSEHPIRIRGTVRGGVESQRRVLVEERANVQATITAHEVVIDGRVEGEVISFGRAHISPTARVVGEVSAQVIVMDDGAYFEGHVEMSGQAGGQDDGLGSGAPESADAPESSDQVPDA